MAVANLTLASNDAVLAAQVVFMNSTTKTKILEFCRLSTLGLANDLKSPICNWVAIIYAHATKLATTSGTLAEANALGLLLYRMLALSAALPAASLSAAAKAAILAAYNSQLVTV